MNTQKSRPATAGTLRRLAAVVTMVGCVVGPAMVAQAHNPEVSAEIVCVDNQAVIRWTTWSWDQASANPDIRIFVDGQLVAQGAFTVQNSFELSGETAWPDSEELTVVLRAEAFADFETGAGLGEFREVTLALSTAFLEECAGITSTTSSSTTSTSTTTASTTTTTQAQSSTTIPTPTSSATTVDVGAAGEVTTTPSTTGPSVAAEAGVVTETTVAAVEVAGIQVSAPAAAVAAQRALPFTGVDAGSAAWLALALGAAGVTLLTAFRPKDDVKTGRSWD
ncbi:MAG TPA: hypothetical protein VJ796_08130 [Acidimicrobiia bacterium]|nr:hypothetical protein [Acidimicrobiia bacterium]